jgi:hypothetical protein
MAFDDPFVADATFESTKIQIVFAAVVSNDAHFLQQTAKDIRTNIELLYTLCHNKAGPNPYVRHHLL